jgi:D-aminopeptidase
VFTYGPQTTDIAAFVDLGMDPEVSAVAFVGYHAAAGAEGVLAHTYLANSITSVRVNGELGSEAG